MKADFTLFFLVIFVAGAILGWDWPNIAKIMPVFVAAIPGLLLVLVQLYRDATGWERNGNRASGGIDMDEVSEVKLDRKTELQRTLTYFAWFIGGALGIWLLGLTYSMPLLVFLYALVEGKEKWITALIMAACTYALVWGLFEYTLETRWPPGILFDR
jgi:tripartite tricarboxylate transporter TctB family protein